MGKKRITAPGADDGTMYSKRSANPKLSLFPTLDVCQDDAPPPYLWREKYACVGYHEMKLRLLFIGHNPSIHAYNSGHFYSNPMNHFWKLLRESGIIPQTYTCNDDVQMPATVRIGFTDLGLVPGNDASTYDKNICDTWKADLWRRLDAHKRRVARTNKILGIAGGDDDAACEPSIIAFSGKRQWSMMFTPPLKSCIHGVQREMPVGWPYKTSVVFVLPSSSGRAAMTHAQRLKPYVELSGLLSNFKYIEPIKSST